MTGQDINDRGRSNIDDDGAPNTYRVSPQDSIRFINDGMGLIWRGRTDSHYAANGTLIVYTEITSLNQGLCLLDEWREALGHYWAYSALQRRSGEKDVLTRRADQKAAFKALTGIEV
jgi:hypothetical protein